MPTPETFEIPAASGRSYLHRIGHLEVLGNWDRRAKDGASTPREVLRPFPRGELDARLSSPRNLLMLNPASGARITMRP